MEERKEKQALLKKVLTLGLKANVMFHATKTLAPFGCWF